LSGSRAAQVQLPVHTFFERALTFTLLLPPPPPLLVEKPQKSAGRKSGKVLPNFCIKV
jgi:hypothetical protein